MMSGKSFSERGPIKSWNDILKYYKGISKEKGNYIFRGQRDSSWGLKPSLERYLCDHNIDLKCMGKIEEGLIRRFKRQSHKYNIKRTESDHTDHKHDISKWWGIMQHYGAPTRILDGTYSFYVALFFAIEATKVDDECAVWALNSDWIKKRMKSKPDFNKLIQKDIHAQKSETLKNIFFKNFGKKEEAFVYPISPFELNDRQAIQQGTFIAPRNLTIPFEENLKKLLKNCKTPNDNIRKIKIKLDFNEYKKTVSELHRMNINNATLFPGIDGFSRHLVSLIWVDGALAPYREKEISLKEVRKKPKKRCCI